ncbi:hypothetical protein HHI36_002722, partial [Cryptolaemus montrouzieri]
EKGSYVYLSVAINIVFQLISVSLRVIKFRRHWNICYSWSYKRNMNTFVVFSFLLCGVYSANILAYSHFPSISHHNFFQAIARELSLRGHQVTFASPNNISDPKLINMTAVDMSETYNIFDSINIEIFNRNSLSMFSICSLGHDMLERIVFKQMEMKQIKDILKKPEKSYDLIVIEAHNPFYYGLQHKFKAPLIAISSLGLHSYLHNIIGNQNHPVLYTDMYCSYTVPLKNIWEKFDSLYVNMVFYLHSIFYAMPRFDEIARTYFGKDMPYLEDIVKEASVNFVNVNPILSDRRAFVPNYKEVWNIHMKLPPSLPEVSIGLIN